MGSRALPASTAARWFLSDVAEVSGFTVEHGGRPISPYVIRRPILTTPDPWFFAGLVALEATKICDLFTCHEAGALLHEITIQADSMVGRRGRIIAKVIFALMGRLGYGAILMRMKVPDGDIGRIIRVLLGGNKDWKHLLPDVKAHRQLYKALGAGTPSWWSDYLRAREAANKKPTGKKKAAERTAPRDEILDLEAPLDLAAAGHQPEAAA